MIHNLLLTLLTLNISPIGLQYYYIIYTISIHTALLVKCLMVFNSAIIIIPKYGSFQNSAPNHIEIRK